MLSAAFRDLMLRRVNLGPGADCAYQSAVHGVKIGGASYAYTYTVTITDPNQ